MKAQAKAAAVALSEEMRQQKEKANQIQESLEEDDAAPPPIFALTMDDRFAMGVHSVDVIAPGAAAIPVHDGLPKLISTSEWQPYRDWAATNKATLSTLNFATRYAKDKLSRAEGRGQLPHPREGGQGGDRRHVHGGRQVVAHRYGQRLR